MSLLAIVTFPVYMIMRNKLRTRNGGEWLLHRVSRAWGDPDDHSLGWGVLDVGYGI